jgi:hypothetical protein
MIFGHHPTYSLDALRERSHIQDSNVGSIEIPADDCVLLGWRLRKPQHRQDSLLWESSFSQTLNDRGAPTHEDDFVNVFDREICVLESLLDLSRGEEIEDEDREEGEGEDSLVP